MKRRRVFNYRTLSRGSKYPIRLRIKGDGEKRLHCSGLPKVKILEPKTHFVFAENFPFGKSMHSDKTRNGAPLPVFRHASSRKLEPSTINLQYEGKQVKAKLEVIRLTVKFFPFNMVKILRASLPNGTKIPLAVWDKAGHRAELSYRSAKERTFSEAI